MISYAVGCMFGRYSVDVNGLSYAGGEWDSTSLTTLLKSVRDRNIKTALYSGQPLQYFINDNLRYLLDYLKVGPYVEALGSVDKPSTNQRLYRLRSGQILEEITPKFWNNYEQENTRTV